VLSGADIDSDFSSDSFSKPTNHLDLEGLDALMHALRTWNGGVIVISHDERFITSVAQEVCGSCLFCKIPSLTYPI